MKCYGFTIRLKDGSAVAPYKAYQRKAWPEIVAPGGALDTIGVRKIQIFYIGPLTLFMYVEAEDEFEPVRDFARALELHPRVKEWDDIMHTQYLVRVEGNDGPMNWAVMERIHSVDHTGGLSDLENQD